MNTEFKSGNGVAGSPQTVTDALVGQARAGDRIIIDIKDVVRRTFLDEEEKVTVSSSQGIISIPIN